MNGLPGDIRYGARMLVKRPGLSALAIVALALGIGLTTTMFSIVYAAVMKGLPYEESDRLMAALPATARPRASSSCRWSIHDFADWRERQKSFEDFAAYYAETVNVSGSEGRPVGISGPTPARVCSTSCASVRSSAAPSARRRTIRLRRR